MNLDKIKKAWLERINENAFIKELEYKNKQGESIKEKVYFKRPLFPLSDWQRIYPPLDENGKIIWINLLFGGKKNLIKLILTLALVGIILFQFAENFRYIEFLKNNSTMINLSKVGYLAIK